MNQAVVELAYEREVVEFGCSAVFPVDDVVGFGPLGGAVARRECASLVSSDERAAELWGDESFGASEVQRYPVGVE
jgi:hypothetical protein